MKLNSRITYETGEWFHVGLSYYNGTASIYMNGCLHHHKNIWNEYSSTFTINEGIRLGCNNNNNIDMQLDEMYFWEARKSALVFSVLYYKDI